MKSLSTEAGIGALCVAVLQQAARDYFMYRNILEDPKKSHKKKIEAKDSLDDLISDFMSGRMDLYTMALSNMDGMDVYKAIVKSYEEKKAVPDKTDTAFEFVS